MFRCWLVAFCLGCGFQMQGQDQPPLDLVEIPLREDMYLEVNGIAPIPGTKAAFTTKRGEVWVLNHPVPASGKFSDFQWRLFASGLHRPGWILWKNDRAFLVQQMNEVTLVSDHDGDGLADEFLAEASEKVTGTEVVSPFKGMVWLETPEKSGLFAGQYLGGSRSGKYLSRLAMISDGVKEHAALFVFLKGLTFPVAAMARLEDGSLVIAQSNRSDPGRTRNKVALHRAVWNESVPFEIQSIEATDAGFRITFTKVFLPESASSLLSYRIESMADQQQLEIQSVASAPDGKSVVLECGQPPKAGVFYHIACDGVWSDQREPVQNPAGMFVFTAKK